jgi:hypothetical protein
VQDWGGDKERDTGLVFAQFVKSNIVFAKSCGRPATIRAISNRSLRRSNQLTSLSPASSHPGGTSDVLSLSSRKRDNLRLQSVTVSSKCRTRVRIRLRFWASGIVLNFEISGVSKWASEVVAAAEGEAPGGLRAALGSRWPEEEEEVAKEGFIERLEEDEGLPERAVLIAAGFGLPLGLDIF